jgi:hypothetical protein
MPVGLQILPTRRRVGGRWLPDRTVAHLPAARPRRRPPLSLALLRGQTTHTSRDYRPRSAAAQAAVGSYRQSSRRAFGGAGGEHVGHPFARASSSCSLGPDHDTCPAGQSSTQHRGARASPRGSHKHAPGATPRRADWPRRGVLPRSSDATENAALDGGRRQIRRVPPSSHRSEKAKSKT